MMEKVSSASVDIMEENIEKLKHLFPEILTDGNKIDFEKLQLILGEEVDGEKERYSFNWPGKREAIIGAQQPSKGTLRPNVEKSKNFDTTENLYIEGDNLEVLKLLQKSYNNKIKVIYIDPPYNTGKDFVYKDNFRDGVNNYLEQTGQVDSEGNLLSTNSESNGRFHTDWLNMMYPRLKLARNLLTEDGVIIIHIDEHEVANLEKIGKEIFGENNFLGNMIWDKRNPKGVVSKISYQHENILFFSKNLLSFSQVEFSLTKDNAKKMINKVEMLKRKNGGIVDGNVRNEYKKWITANRKSLSGGEAAYKYISSEGRIYRLVSMAAPDKPETRSHRKLIHPITMKECPVPAKGWRFTDSTMDKLINEQKVEFGVTDDTQPQQIYYLDENLHESVSSIIRYGGEGKIYDLPFNNPKPLEIVKKVLSSVSKSDDIILDFFSGSGTVAEAVMQLNNEDRNQRKYIMIQLPENTIENSMAYKQGYVTIPEIAIERIERSIKNIELNLNGNKISLDTGYKFFHLYSSNLKEWNTDFASLENELDLFSDVFVEGRSELDIVYEIMLKNGLELTLPVDIFEVNGKRIYDIAFGHQFICLSDEIDTSVSKAIIEKYREYGPEFTSGVVFKDSGFNGNDSEKLNCIQLLKDAGFIEANLQTI